MEHYFSSGLASSTRKVYTAAITRYIKFCNQFLFNASPTSEQLLCRFVTYLAMDRVSASSLSVYLSAVRQLHLQQGLPPPAVREMPRLQQVLRGIKREQARAPNPAPSQRSRLPITPTLLRSIWHSWPDRLLVHDKVMLWAAFTTCFFGFMRSGELCIHDSTKGFDETTDLTFTDVAVDNYQNPYLIRIHLKSSKTDPFCKGTDILLGRTRDELCPVAAMLQWLVRIGNAPGPLFLFALGAPLTRPRLVSSLRSIITQMGGVASGFSDHSFRSDAATTAAQLNIPDSQIKLLGRWKSSAFQRYLKPPLTHLARLSSSLSSSTTISEPSTLGLQENNNSVHHIMTAGQPRQVEGHSSNVA